MKNWCASLRGWLRRTPSPAPRRLPQLEPLETRLAPALAAPTPQASIAAAYANASFGPLIGLDGARANFPYKGDGYSVAVLDTGIDYNHPALGGAWGKRVIAGYDFVNNDADPLDDNGHGTHVAGIIGSSSSQYPGVAPDVNLI